jgi:hypothetical protein
MSSASWRSHAMALQLAFLCVFFPAVGAKPVLAAGHDLRFDGQTARSG